jgi:Ca2+-binding RTX toxin-like protein
MTRHGRWTLLALTVVAAMLACSAAVLAGADLKRATITGDGGDNRLVGTRQSDLLRGRGGDDEIRGRGGGDLLKGGRGRDQIGGGKGFDRLLGGRGRDRLAARDGRPDELECGKGADTAVVDGHEDGVFDCERLVTPRR